MIYTNMKNFRRYIGLDTKLDKAIEYILSHDVKSLENGIHEIDGKDIYINRHEYDSIPADKGNWEGHRDYLDIQMVLEGQEMIGVSSASALECLSYNEERDRYSFSGAVESWINMRPGDLLILYPEDAHMVKVQLEGQTHLQKACVKVRV